MKRFLPFAALAVALAGCDASNPVAPVAPENGGAEPAAMCSASSALAQANLAVSDRGSGSAVISLTAEPQALVAGSNEPGTVTVTVTDGAGAEATISTDLGHFLNRQGSAVQLCTLTLTGGVGRVDLFPGDQAGDATLTVVVGIESQVLVVPIRETAQPLTVDFEAATQEDQLTVIFTDKSAPVPDAWAWDFGDGACPSGLAPGGCAAAAAADECCRQNPVHTYPAPDTYVTTLRASRGGGAPGSKSQFVAVGGGPPPPPAELAADFAADVGAGTGLTVIFTDMSAGEPTSWSWSFGDGSCGGEIPAAECTQQSPIHTYPVPAEYVVTLTVTSAEGLSASKSKLVAVGSGLPPLVADFDFVVTMGSLIVTFTDESTGTIAAHAWNFGDPGCQPQPDCSTSSEQDPVHQYAFSGDYVAVLTVTDPTGASDTASEVVTVDTGEEVPVADFTFQRLGGLTVRFLDESSNTPTSWNWDFGDGTSAATQNPIHEFPAPGDYLVTLVAQNGAGASDPFSQIVNPEPLDAQFGFQQNGCIGVFTDQSTGGPNRWQWDFGDPDCDSSPDCNASEEQNPTHDYTQPGGGCDFGDYSVELTVMDAAGGSDSITRTVSILPFE